MSPDDRGAICSSWGRALGTIGLLLLAWRWASAEKAREARVLVVRVARGATNRQRARAIGLSGLRWLRRTVVLALAGVVAGVTLALVQERSCRSCWIQRKARDNGGGVRANTRRAAPTIAGGRHGRASRCGHALFTLPSSRRPSKPTPRDLSPPLKPALSKRRPPRYDAPRRAPTAHQYARQAGMEGARAIHPPAFRQGPSGGVR
jgi:hypothetical protein